MHKYPNIETCGNSKQKLVDLTGDRNLPWWDGHPTGPSRIYFLHVLDPSELGEESLGYSEVYESEQKIFRFVKLDGNQEIIIADGLLEYQRTISKRRGVELEMKIRSQKLGEYFIIVPTKPLAA